MDRVAELRMLIDTKGRGLEIGPSYSPLLPKREGFNVQVVDHLSRQSLCSKYSGTHVDTSLIEEVDFIWDGRPLFEVVGEINAFDYIVASHVIEHVPNPISFFEDCNVLLKERGKLLLAVPDKRFCFDALRPLSSAGQVLQASLECRTRHLTGVYLDNFLYRSGRGDDIVWHQDDKRKLDLSQTVLESFGSFEHVRRTLLSSDEYVDVHAWAFTPSSFRFIFEALRQGKYLSLAEVDFRLPGSFEFFLTYSKSGAGPNVEISELLRRTVTEMAAVHA